MENELRRVRCRKTGRIYTVLLNAYNRPVKVIQTQCKTGEICKLKAEAEARILKEMRNQFLSENPSERFNDTMDEFAVKHPILSTAIVSTVAVLTCFVPA